MKTMKSTSVFFILAILLSALHVNIGWTKSLDSKVKDKIDAVSGSLKEAVDRIGDDANAVQDYLDHYHWKGLVQEESTAGAVTLKHLQLNGHSRAVVVKPGEKVEGFIVCDLDRSKCSLLSVYRVVLGIKGQGAQTTVGNELGLVAGESLEKFHLVAPQEPGFYQVRFRLVESLREKTALQSWVDEQGNEPDGTTTIGVIYVKA